MNTNMRIRWRRVVAAAFLSEAAVVAVLILIATTYRFLVAPGKGAGEYQAFGEIANYYAAPVAAGLATFFSAIWATRKLTSSFIANGALVGVAAVVLTLGFLFAAKPEDRLMYGVSFVLRILGGYLGGVAIQRARNRRSPSPLPA